MKKGRPPLADGHTAKRMNITVPKPIYDKICELAEEKDLPLSAVARAAFRVFLHTKTDKAPS